MPYKSEKIPIAGTKNDRRVKLDDHQKACMKAERERDGTSYNKLAKAYGCSKRLAIFICNPEIAEKAKSDLKERRKDGRYYVKDRNTKHMRDHRRYKQDLHVSGEI